MQAPTAIGRRSRGWSDLEIGAQAFGGGRHISIWASRPLIASQIARLPTPFLEYKRLRTSPIATQLHSEPIGGLDGSGPIPALTAGHEAVKHPYHCVSRSATGCSRVFPGVSLCRRARRDGVGRGNVGRLAIRLQAATRGPFPI